MAFLRRYFVVVFCLLLFIVLSFFARHTKADQTFDATPPITTIAITCGSTTSYTSGSNTYTCSTTSASISISCSDSGTGCQRTYHTIDGTSDSFAGNGPLDTTLSNTTSSHTITAYSIDNAGNYTAGYPPPVSVSVIFFYTISGILYGDANGSDTIDAGDPAFTAQSVTMTLKNTNGAIVATTNTSTSNGTYAFSNIAAGSYTLSAATPTNYKDVLPASQSITIPPAASAINFLVRGYTINGTVYSDANHDCTVNGSDAELSGATVTLGIGQTYTTVGTGTNFSFTYLPAYSSQTTQASKAGYILSSCAGNPNTPNPRLTPIGPDQLNLRFFLTQTYSISGNAFIDTNHDGVQNNGESVYPASLSTSISSSPTGGTPIYPSNGTYQITGLISNTYRVTFTVPGGYTATTGTCTPDCKTAAYFDVILPDPISGSNAINKDFGITQLFSISGNAYVDFADNITKDVEDENFSGRTITLSGGDTAKPPTTTDASGNYSFTNLLGSATQYTVTVTVPPGYLATTAASYSYYLGPSRTGVDFALAPLYSIKGMVWVDDNKNKTKDTLESAYGGQTTIDIASNVGPTNCSSYVAHLTPGSIYNSGVTIPAGTYRVCYQFPPPAGYTVTYLPGTPPSFTVTLGTERKSIACRSTPPTNTMASCYTDPASSSNSTNGSVQNLNFGITNSNPWFRCNGGNCRIDTGISDPIPAGAASCGGEYASLAGTGTTSNSPGIFFSGDQSYNFCVGEPCKKKASTLEWASGNDTAAVFSPANGTIIRTSYNYLLTSAQQGGITSTDLAPYCGSGGIANCVLDQSLPNGIYKADGNLTIDTNPTAGTYTFPTYKNFVILINGTLTIKANIKVPLGSTALFSAKGNILVDGNLGAPAIGSDNTTIEGIYSADGSFDTGGNNGICTGAADKRLNIAGTVVVNANGGGGTFMNSRDLCLGNLTCPSYAIFARPDFLLNAPDIIKHPNFIWQEVAP